MSWKISPKLVCAALVFFFHEFLATKNEIPEEVEHKVTRPDKASPSTAAFMQTRSRKPERQSNSHTQLESNLLDACKPSYTFQGWCYRRYH